jgi:hypothetical protein
MQKMYIDTTSGRDKRSRSEAKRLLCLLKLENVNWERGYAIVPLICPLHERERITKVITKFFPITIHTPYSVSVPLFCSPHMWERKQLPLHGFLCHAWDNQSWTQILEFFQMNIGIFIDHSKEGSILNHIYKVGVEFMVGWNVDGSLNF